MKREKMLEVCPICGSADLYYEAGGYTGKIYHCKNCDYAGALIVKADDETMSTRNANESRSFFCVCFFWSNYLLYIFVRELESLIKK